MENYDIALVTGATGAIGKAIARKIAEKNFRVVLIARNEQKAKATVDEIIDKTGNKNVGFELADLSKKTSIASLAENWMNPVNVLVNDAGVTPRERMETDQGIEIQWATNVLGYYWMMSYFRDHLKKAASARVVNVASYWAGGLDLDDPEFRIRHYDNDTAYRQSKQADRMLSAGFAKQFKDDKIAVNACHPGDVKSNLSSNLGYGGHESPDQGADTPAWLATAPVGIENSGSYFEHRRKSEDRFTSDQAQVKKLMDLCESY